MDREKGENMKLKDMMNTNLIKTSLNSTVSDAAKLMDAKNIGSLLIEGNGKIIGIISERDILRKIVAKGKDPAKTPVMEIMSSPLITISPEKSIDDANELMIQKKIRRLLVEENGKIIGFVNMRDISHNLKYMIGLRITGHDEYARG